MKQTLATPMPKPIVASLDEMFVKPVAQKTVFKTPAKAKKTTTPKEQNTAASSDFKTTEASVKNSSSGQPSLASAKSNFSSQGQYSAKGTYSNGRPRNFYNPPHKVLKQLQ